MGSNEVNPTPIEASDNQTPKPNEWRLWAITSLGLSATVSSLTVEIATTPVAEPKAALILGGATIAMIASGIKAYRNSRG